MTDEEGDEGDSSYEQELRWEAEHDYKRDGYMAAADLQLEWYRAKIIDLIPPEDKALYAKVKAAKRNKPLGISNRIKTPRARNKSFSIRNGDLVKVHFDGWNASTDEWILFKVKGYFCTIGREEEGKPAEEEGVAKLKPPCFCVSHYEEAAYNKYVSELPPVPAPRPEFGLIPIQPTPSFSTRRKRLRKRKEEDRESESDEDEDEEDEDDDDDDDDDDDEEDSGEEVAVRSKPKSRTKPSPQPKQQHLSFAPSPQVPTATVATRRSSRRAQQEVEWEVVFPPIKHAPSLAPLPAVAATAAATTTTTTAVAATTTTTAVAATTTTTTTTTAVAATTTAVAVNVDNDQAMPDVDEENVVFDVKEEEVMLVPTAPSLIAPAVGIIPQAAVPVMDQLAAIPFPATIAPKADEETGEAPTERAASPAAVLQPSLDVVPKAADVLPSPDATNSVALLQQVEKAVSSPKLTLVPPPKLAHAPPMSLNALHQATILAQLEREETEGFVIHPTPVAAITTTASSPNNASSDKISIDPSLLLTLSGTSKRPLFAMQILEQECEKTNISIERLLRDCVGMDSLILSGRRWLKGQTLLRHSVLLAASMIIEWFTAKQEHRKRQSVMVNMDQVELFLKANPGLAKQLKRSTPSSIAPVLPTTTALNPERETRYKTYPNPPVVTMKRRVQDKTTCTTTSRPIPPKKLAKLGDPPIKTATLSSSSSASEAEEEEEGEEEAINEQQAVLNQLVSFSRVNMIHSTTGVGFVSCMLLLPGAQYKQYGLVATNGEALVLEKRAKIAVRKYMNNWSCTHCPTNLGVEKDKQEDALQQRLCAECECELLTVAMSTSTTSGFLSSSTTPRKLKAVTANTPMVADLVPYDMDKQLNSTTYWRGNAFPTSPDRVAERRTYFTRFEFRKQDVRSQYGEFRVLDHVIVCRRCDPDEVVEDEQKNSPDYFVGQIEALWEEEETRAKLCRINWFFWTEEADNQMSSYAQVGTSTEVFTSSEVDSEPVFRVLAKTTVLSAQAFETHTVATNVVELNWNVPQDLPQSSQLMEQEEEDVLETSDLVPMAPPPSSSVNWRGIHQGFVEWIVWMHCKKRRREAGRGILEGAQAPTEPTIPCTPISLIGNTPTLASSPNPSSSHKRASTPAILAEWELMQTEFVNQDICIRALTRANQGPFFAKDHFHQRKLWSPRPRIGKWMQPLLVNDEFGFTYEEAKNQCAMTCLRMFFGTANLYSFPILAMEWTAWEAAKLLDSLALHGLAWETVAPLFVQPSSNGGGGATIDLISREGKQELQEFDFIPEPIVRKDAHEFVTRVQEFYRKRAGGRKNLLGMLKGSVYAAPAKRVFGCKVCHSSNADLICDLLCLTCNEELHSACLPVEEDRQSQLRGTAHEYYCPDCLVDERGDGIGENEEAEVLANVQMWRRNGEWIKEVTAQLEGKKLPGEIIPRANKRANVDDSLTTTSEGSNNAADNGLDAAAVLQREMQDPMYVMCRESLTSTLLALQQVKKERDLLLLQQQTNTHQLQLPTLAPTKQQTLVPTKQPLVPTGQPTLTPSAQPTLIPTKQPTLMPSTQPTLVSTGQPRFAPIVLVSTQPAPIVQPTLVPTKQPTLTPSAQPALVPTKQPTLMPSVQPTLAPTKQPMLMPGAQPTLIPTKQPTLTPTKQPTLTPTLVPTLTPTTQPTLVPTKQPTLAPTAQPTLAPSAQPAKTPTTPSPTKRPTKAPTATPTKRPTKAPTTRPTKRPTGAPTKRPTKVPTAVPTKRPTKAPTNAPTKKPTKAPTAKPTKRPTKTPTKRPTKVPTKTPTKKPTTAKPAAAS
ncbi:hypothetical protein BASA81_008325 [Batrachochytrium salamandrivorans]|nr:hypothetical protein BASA81_008325 [Batrachochytrium salamandrivorans]